MAFEWTSNRGGTTELNRQAGMNTLNNNWNVYDYTLYTSDSAKDGYKDGGAGVVVTTSSPENPQTKDTIVLATGALTSSYASELKAMDIALNWIANRDDAKAVRIVSDSQSVLKHLKCHQRRPHKRC